MNILTILITGIAFRWSYFIIGGGLGVLLLILGCYAAYNGYIPIPSFAPETNDYNKPDTPEGTKDRVINEVRELTCII